MPVKIFRAGKIFPALLILAALLLLPGELKGQDSDSWDDEPLFTEYEGITVTGSLQTTQQMKIIDKEEIERYNASDLANLLQEALNLNLTRYGSYGSMLNINLRGFDSKRVAFLIDGTPLNSAQNGEFDINQIGLNGIERIEVIYGGSDTKYNVSGALGGVINIITVKKQNPGFKLGAGVSNLSVLPTWYFNRGDEKQSPNWEDLADTQNYSLSASYGGSGFSVSANTFVNRAENHFYFSDTYGIIRRKDNNEVLDAGVTASLIKKFSNYSKLIFSPNFYYADKNIPNTGFSPDAGKQKDMSARHNLMFEMPRAFHDNLSAEASFVYYLTKRDYISPAEAESRHQQQSVTLINRWNWYAGQPLILRSGFDYRFIYLDSTEMGIRDRQDGGFYITAEWKPANSFLIISSVKAAFTSGGQGGVTPIPKLGFLWDVNDSLTIKNNYFRSFKFPDFEDLYWTGGGAYGNPDLKPEDGWGGDIGAAWRFKELFSLDSAFFVQWTSDSIHWYSGGGGLWRPENVGEAIFFGMDSKLNFEIPVSFGSIKKIIPSISYQYLLSYLLSYGYTYDSDKRIPYMPAHTIGASLDIPWKTGSLIISAHYESRRYTSRENITVLKPHTMLNATVNQRTGKFISIFAALRNILNESYESFDRYPMPGFTLTTGVRLQYEEAK